MSDEYDYLFKCICVGDGGCGKTALVVRFSQGFFQEQYKLTIGVEFAVKTIDLNEIDKKVKLQIWDTGGQERFQYVRPLYYRGSMGAIILFDLTNRESFEHIPTWMEEVKANAGDVPMLLVGNKSDLTDKRKVSTTEAQELAKEFEMYYLESSAKNGTGVGDVFAILSCLMIGIDVPDAYIQGTTITDSNGNVLGSSAVEEPIESIPEPVESIPEVAPIPEPEISIPKPEPVSNTSQGGFFDIRNQINDVPPVEAIPMPKEPSANSLPSAFSEEKSEEELPPPFENVSSQSPSFDVPDDEDLFNIPPVPAKSSMVSKVPEPEPVVEEWPVTDVPTPSNPISSPESVSSQPIDIPSATEVDASIPAIPARKTVAQGPITFDDEDFSPIPQSPASSSKSSPPPLVFTEPDDIPLDEFDIGDSIPPVPKKAEVQHNEPSVWSPNPQPQIPTPQQSQPIQPKPKSRPQAPITFTNSPKPEKSQGPITFGNAKPAAPPAGFKPKTATSNPIFGGQEPKPKKAAPFTNTPFTSVGVKDTSSSTAFDSLLGALGTKPNSRPAVSNKPVKNDFTPFSKGNNTVKKSAPPSFFRPVNKENQIQLTEIKPITPAPAAPARPSTAAQPVAKKEKKKEKRRKKNKNIVICPTCGAILSVQYKFCNKCGTKL